jgi:argininosuccinate lyase
MLATDLAEYLVARGVPFRQAHEAVSEFLATGTPIDAESLRAFHPKFGADVAAILDPRAAVSRRTTPGGPAPEAVLAQLVRVRDALGLERYSLSKHAESVHLVHDILTEASK